jgi:hypothetical protein
MALPNTDPFSVRPPLPHEQLRIKVTERRRRYLTLGYEPIPIISGRKRPALDDWRKTKLDLDTVSAWANGRSATDVRGVLTPLKGMAEELNVAVIGISHFNKKDDIKSALLRVSDSIAYVAAARHVYAVLDDPEDKNSKLFVKAKNNLARDAKALRYGMSVKTVGHDNRLEVDINAPYIVWHPQHVEITANEAMTAAGGHTARREAKEFLLQRLEAGPVKADDVIDEAKQEGIAERTLKRAKKELGIKSRKTPARFLGHGPGSCHPKGSNHHDP